MLRETIFHLKASSHSFFFFFVFFCSCSFFFLVSFDIICERWMGVKRHMMKINMKQHGNGHRAFKRPKWRGSEKKKKRKIKCKTTDDRHQPSHNTSTQLQHKSKTREYYFDQTKNGKPLRFWSTIYGQCTGYNMDSHNGNGSIFFTFSTSFCLKPQFFSLL